MRAKISTISINFSGFFSFFFSFVQISRKTTSFSFNALSMIVMCQICGGFNLPIKSQVVIIIIS
ncbi:MAG: hypothetical protein LBU14_03195 [Candidatus Peribacteria bacterium]|nr:hypothetical protein [Candidatus Peribacteria bacterium]